MYNAIYKRQLAKKIERNPNRKLKISTTKYILVDYDIFSSFCFFFILLLSSPPCRSSLHFLNIRTMYFHFHVIVNRYIVYEHFTISSKLLLLQKMNNHYICATNYSRINLAYNNIYILYHVS